MRQPFLSRSPPPPLVQTKPERDNEVCPSGCVGQSLRAQGSAARASSNVTYASAARAGGPD
jgi:hypothetical protein